MAATADSGPTPSQAWPLERPRYTSLAAAVQGETARWNIPGVSVAVLHDGVVEEVASGITSIQTKQPLRTDAVFQAGSISKVFAATLAMTLVDEGKLDLDAPVVTYLPELKLGDAGAQAALTMRHLLSHSSGIEGDRFDNHGRGDDAIEKAVAALATVEQWFQPGELYTYSNASFYVAGLVTQRLIGKNWEAALQERVLDPWKMTNTVLFAEDAITLPHAVGHSLASREAGYTIARPYWHLRHATPAGGVMTTAGDLIRFAQGHLGGGELEGARVISAASAELMRQPVIRAGIGNDFYGIGWSLNRYATHSEFGHGGSTDGFQSNLLVIPEHEFAIATLTNADPGRSAIGTIEAWATEHFLGFTTPKPEPLSVDEAVLQAVAGRYRRHNMQAVLTVEDERLAAVFAPIDPGTNEPMADTSMHLTFRLQAVASETSQAFRVTEGPFEGIVAELLAAPTTAEPERQLLRFGGRLLTREQAR